MGNINNFIDNKINKNIEDLKVEFFKNKKDTDFVKIVNKINLNDDYLIKYTSKIKQCAIEEKNCNKCNSLDNCKNEVIGCKYSPLLINGNLLFSHKACKFKKELLNDIEYIKEGYVFSISKEVRNAKMKDIYTNDKNRVEVIKWVTTFIKNYKEKKAWKGLYLSGSFGSGKSYIISAMINELVKNGYKGALIYYPEFLRNLKASFGKDFDSIFNYAKTSDILLLDDIGAESVSSWSRDEILGPILQYRMDEKLPTFFTSNLNLKELELHLSYGNGQVDKVKAKRIIERIKYITDSIELISENKRN